MSRERQHRRTATTGTNPELSSRQALQGGTEQARAHTLPPGFPLPLPKRISWATQHDTNAGCDTKQRAQGGNDASRHADIAIGQTAQRITKRDLADKSIIGELPLVVRHVGYLPSSVYDILPSQIVGPDDLFDPGAGFVSRILTLMQRRPPVPSLPPFRFGITPPELKHNARVLAAAGFDFAQLLPLHQRSTLGFGSEFRPVADLQPLLAKHPLFPFVAKILSEGISYEYHVGQQLTESECLVEMAGQLQRGNHKSASDEIEKVRTLLARDVTHGFTVPLPSIACAPQIKGAMIQPLGVVKQWSLDEQGKRVAKFPLTQDLSFSLDA
jgi:hypothetical protein